MFRKRYSSKARRYRPNLQFLETRNLLSTCVVDHLADDGVGTGHNGDLRYCITNAVDGDVITFNVTGTINLTSALPNLTHNISINGPGANLLTVRRDTGGNYRIFTVDHPATVAISGLTIANGYYVDYWYGRGGGIFNAGTLSVSNCMVSANDAGDGGGVPSTGGGIFNAGALSVSNCTVSANAAADGGGISNAYDATLTISNSTIAGNEATGNGAISADGEGGGILNGGTMTVSDSTIAGNIGYGGFEARGIGGILNYATLTISNSTIYGNTAGSAYGVGGISNPGTLTVSNSTITGNSGSFGACGIAGGGTLNMRNSIVAANFDYAHYEGDVDEELTSSGYNLIGNGDGASGFVDTDLVGTFDHRINPRLGPLQNNGGPTQTMALFASSPALNAGDPAQFGVPDQRGVVRVGGVNIGAYQASASAFVLTAPATVTAGTPFDVTVKAVDVFGQTAFGYTGTVTFSSTDTDPNVVLPTDYAFTTADQGMHTFSGGFTLLTPGDEMLTATDSASGFSASTVVTVQGAGPAPGRHRATDSVDALFAVLAAEWRQLAPGF